MDSLISSAIALAAGGWQNVKLVRICTANQINLPTWKLGVCSIPIISYLDTSTTISIAPQSTILVAPGTSISCGGGGSTFTLATFTNTVVSVATGHNITAVLFTW